jgi:hypothetical protein
MLANLHEDTAEHVLAAPITAVAPVGVQHSETNHPVTQKRGIRFGSGGVY